MNIKYLAVDSNVAFANAEAMAWKHYHDIGMEQADNMTSAIQKLLLNNSYLFIGINDDVIDFLPLLSTMRSVTNSPILIATGRFTTHAEVEALDNGADLYARWHESTEGNIASVLAHINRKNKRDIAPLPLAEIIIYKDLLITPLHRNAFMGNGKMDLTRHEFDLLYYLMLNHGKVMSYSQTYKRVWNGDYDNSTKSALWDAIKRLRGKLKILSDLEYIENVRDFGYRFPLVSNL